MTSDDHPGPIQQCPKCDAALSTTELGRLYCTECGAEEPYPKQRKREYLGDLDNRLIHWFLKPMPASYFVSQTWAGMVLAALAIGVLLLA